MSRDNIPRGAPGRHPTALKPLPKGELKPGGVVFFPTCKKTTRGQPIVFRGHGFGVFLGVVPQMAAEPNRYMIDPLMAGVGWISFAHIREFLGDEVFDDLAVKFRAKYELEPVKDGEVVPEVPPPPEIAMPAEKRLVGLDGQPI